MELFTKYEGVFCKEPNCGKFRQIVEPRQTTSPNHYATDITLDGDVFDCPDGHRHVYYSRDVAESSWPDGRDHHYLHR